MKAFFTASILFIPLLVFTITNERASGLRLPTCISFMKPFPPDSIQTFVKPYLQSKKMKIMEWDEVNRLAGVEINSKAMALINSGDLSKRAIEKLPNQLDPVSNILSIQIFQNLTDSANYIIDSIQWQIRYVPAKDTTAVHKAMYIPEKSSEKNPYIRLKGFLDKVMVSGYLK